MSQKNISAPSENGGTPMAEYIEREKVVKYLRSRSGDFIDDYGKGWSNGISAAAKICEKVPAADVVEVVRCKDCKYWDCGVCELHSEEPDQYSTGLEIEMFADDYCSYGERRVTDG